MQGSFVLLSMQSKTGHSILQAGNIAAGSCSLTLHGNGVQMHGMQMPMPYLHGLHQYTVCYLFTPELRLCL